MLVHAIMPASRANGPGLRCVVFVQGCNLNCPGCFNPWSHAFHGPDLAIEVNPRRSGPLAPPART